jgi:hypothetical protein
MTQFKLPEPGVKRDWTIAIFSVVLTALVTGLLGIWQLRQSFEHADKIERRKEVKNEVRILERIDRELGRGIEALLTYEKPFYVRFRGISFMGLSKMPKKVMEPYQGTMIEQIDSMYVVTAMNIPRRELDSIQWQGYYEVPDLDIDLVYQLDRLYEDLHYLNRDAQAIARYFVGSTISAEAKAEVDQRLGQMNAAREDMGIDKVKDRVVREKEKLEKSTVNTSSEN